MNGFYKFAISVLRFVMPLWYKLETEGLENVPEGSGYLFVSNHRSNADPILIGVQNPETQFCFLAKQELFSDGLVGWLLKKLGAVAVDRGAGDVTALEEIEFRLQNGQNALIFPEGTRSKDGKLGHFKTGAALIASQTGVPVVPVAISFDDELHFRSKIYIRYGAPFDIPKTTVSDPEPAVLKQVRQDMSKHVSALLELNEKAMEAERAGLALPDFGEPEPVPEDAPAHRSKAAAESGEERPRNRQKPAAPAKPPSAEEAAPERPARRKPEEAQEHENRINRKAEERDQKMSKHLNENPAENEAEKDTVKNTGDKVPSVTSELEDIISGVEKDTEKAAGKLRDKKEKLSDAVEDTAEDLSDAAEDLADGISDAADEDYDVDEEIRQAMMEDAAGAALPFKIRNPFKKKLRGDLPEDDQADAPADADADFYDDGAAEKGSLFGGISLKNPFRKKDEDYDDEDEYDEDDQDFDDEDYDDDYDDEYEDEERHVDLGKIALILTFVILGIFAIDFARRLIHDWRSEEGNLTVQSHDSSQVESMNAAETDLPAITTGLQLETTRYTIEITVETTTATVGTDVSGVTTLGTTFLDKRPTETLAVPNESKRSGCLALIDSDHQQVFTPNLLAFNQFPIEHLRMVSPVNQKVDAQLAAPLKNMFNDFFNATGIGNVLVYNTTDTPAYPPYSVSLPERSTGLTLDFAILNEAAKSHAPYTPDGNYAWLTEHACDYGFIVRYPTNKSEKTGMDALTWHFRYVGAPHAKYMYDNDLCLEEYLDTVAAHPWNSQHLTATVAGITYEMYYVPASETTATTDIQYPVNENGAMPMVSGDNINGFVVAVARE